MDIGQVALLGIAVTSYFGVNPILAPPTTEVVGVGLGLEFDSVVRLEVEGDELVEPGCTVFLG